MSDKELLKMFEEKNCKICDSVLCAWRYEDKNGKCLNPIITSGIEKLKDKLKGGK